MLNKLMLYLGKEIVSPSGKRYYIRKRLFHKGFQISEIKWDKFHYNNVYVFERDVDNYEDLVEIIKELENE